MNHSLPTYKFNQTPIIFNEPKSGEYSPIGITQLAIKKESSPTKMESCHFFDQNSESIQNVAKFKFILIHVQSYMYFILLPSPCKHPWQLNLAIKKESSPTKMESCHFFDQNGESIQNVAKFKFILIHVYVFYIASIKFSL